MCKRIEVLIILLLVSQRILFSQQLSHQVMVPAAGVISTGSVSYSQTVGETAIEVIGSSGYVFTQGFQQPGIKVTSEILPEGNGVEVYPNPAQDFIYIKLFGDNPRSFRIDLINIAGTIIRSGTISFSEQYHYIQSLEVGSLKSGLYIVRILSEDRLINRSFKIEKL